MNARRRAGNSGFTVLELAITVLILGIIAAVILPIYLSQKHKAEESEALNEVASVGALYARAFSLGETPVIGPVEVSTSQERVNVDGAVYLSIPPVNGSGYCVLLIDVTGVIAHYRDTTGSQLGYCSDINGPIIPQGAPGADIPSASPAPSSSGSPQPSDSTAPSASPVPTVSATAIPVPVNDTASVLEGNKVLIDVLANDSTGAVLDSVILAPLQGTATIVNGSILYDAPLGSTGQQLFTYSIVGSPVTASVSVDVATALGINVANDSASVLAGDSVLIDVLANDPAGSKIGSIVTQPSRGTATVEGTRIRYTAPANYEGKVTFTYTRVGSPTQATVTITSMKEPPALLLVSTVTRNTTVSLNVFDLAGVPRGTLTSVNPSQGSKNGTVTSWTPDGTINYTAPAGTGSHKIEFSYSKNGKTVSGNKLTVTII